MGTLVKNAMLYEPIYLDIRDYGASASIDCGPSVQAALNDSASKGRPIYIPSGVWPIATTSVVPTDFKGVIGDGDTSILLLSANLPILDLDCGGLGLGGKIFSDFKVTGQFGALDPYTSSKFLNVHGNGSLGYSTFRNLYLQSIFDGITIDTTPITTSFGLESQSGWNRFDQMTFWSGSRDMSAGVRFKRGSSTGNAFLGTKASPGGGNAAVLRFEGTGCVVGDIIYYGEHLGSGYLASFANDIVYNRSMIFDSQVDAGSAGPLLFDSGQTTPPNNIKARGSFGGNQQWANVPPLRFSHIDDLGHSRWAAGGKIANSATSGAQTMNLWDIELASSSGCEITVAVEGLLGGVEAGLTKRKFYVTRLNGNVRIVSDTVTQIVDGGAIPSGWMTLAAVVSGSHVVIQCSFTPNGTPSQLNTTIVVEGGAHRVFRVAGSVEL